MIKFNNQQEAILAIQALDHNEIDNEKVKEAFIKNRSLPVLGEMITKVAELIYARKEDFPEDFLEVAIKCIALFTENNWGGMLVDNRGIGLIQALMKEQGVPGDFPEEGPEPLQEFKDLETPNPTVPAMPED
jgi:hypothetical protein